MMSIALISLPVQQSFAAVMSMDMADTEMTHCQDPATSTDTLYSASSVSDISYDCCCDNCDTSCSTHCSLGATVTALLSTSLDKAIEHNHAIRIETLPHFTSHTLAPPSPPPLV